MASRLRFLLAVSAFVFVSLPAAAATVSTPFGGANGGADAIYFDIVNTSAQDVVIQGEFEFNLGGTINAGEGAGLLTDVSAYYRSGTWVGAETSSAGWSLLATVTDVSVAGNNLVTTVDFGTGFVIPAGETYGLAVFESVAGSDVNFRYVTPGQNAVGTVIADDGTLQILAGASSTALFGGTFFEPRDFQGSVTYGFAPPEVVLPVPVLSPIGFTIMMLALLMMAGSALRRSAMSR